VSLGVIPGGQRLIIPGHCGMGRLPGGTLILQGAQLFLARRQLAGYCDVSQILPVAGLVAGFLAGDGRQLRIQAGKRRQLFRNHCQLPV